MAPDQQGRHLDTIDAQTGVTLFEMTYNDEHQLTSVVDEHGWDHDFERDPVGTPLAYPSDAPSPVGLAVAMW